MSFQVHALKNIYFQPFRTLFLYFLVQVQDLVQDFLCNRGIGIWRLIFSNEQLLTLLYLSKNI